MMFGIKVTSEQASMATYRFGPGLRPFLPGVLPLAPFFGLPGVLVLASLTAGLSAAAAGVLGLLSDLSAIGPGSCNSTSISIDISV